MKFNQVINNFSSGEWSPKMRARTDVQQYQNACDTMINFIPQIQGGAFRAPGTTYVNLGATHNARVQAAITSGLAVMIPRSLSNGTKQVLIIPRVATPSTDWTVWSHDQSTAYALNSVSTGADFTDVLANTFSYEQIGDIVIITDTSGTKPPRVWTYVSATDGGNLYSWDEYIRTVQNSLTGAEWKSTPYMPINALGSPYNITMTAGAATGTTTLTASAAYFSSTMVGTRFKLSSAGSTGVGRVTFYTSTTQMTFVVESTVPTVACGVAAGTSWEEASWSTLRGFPKFVTSFQGRIIFGGTTKYPDTLWGSRIGNVFDFMERPFEQDDYFDTYAADNSRPFALSPNTSDANNLMGMSAAKSLMILTEKAELIASGTQGALGPLDISFESSTTFGAEKIRPARINNYLTFVQRRGRKLRDMIFNFNEDQYKASDLAFISDHLTDTSAELQQVSGATEDPLAEILGCELGNSSMVLCRTLYGNLLGVVLDREYQITSWCQLPISGTVGSFSTATVYAMASIPSAGSPDTVYLLVGREVNGTETIQLEKFLVLTGAKLLAQTTMMHMHSQKTFTSGSPTTAVTGATHLAGNDVQVIADGQYVGVYTVGSGGTFTLTKAASSVTYGLKALAKLKPMPPELGQQIPGSSQGLTKRVNEVSIRFFNTYAAKYGANFSTNALFPINFKDSTVPMDNTPVMFTGIKKLSLDGGYGVDQTVCIQCDTPWPCNVLSIIQRGTTND